MRSNPGPIIFGALFALAATALTSCDNEKPVNEVIVVNNDSEERPINDLDKCKPGEVCR